jgi:hypothetical protein
MLEQNFRGLGGTVQNKDYKVGFAQAQSNFVNSISCKINSFFWAQLFAFNSLTRLEQTKNK